jgi:hypothetical protein
MFSLPFKPALDGCPACHDYTVSRKKNARKMLGYELKAKKSTKGSGEPSANRTLSLCTSRKHTNGYLLEKRISNRWPMNSLLAPLTSLTKAKSP